MLSFLLRLPGYLCIGTCLAQILFFGYLIKEGRLGKAQVNEIVAVMYGVDSWSLSDYVADTKDEEFKEPPDYFLHLEQDVVVGLDLDLRENEIEKGIIDLQTYRDALDDERSSYDTLRLRFEDRFSRIDGRNSTLDVVAVQRALEVMQPRQAKQQLVNMFTSGDPEITNDAVAIVKSLPIDKRRKILAEFKTELESQQLADIFRQIRDGVPEVPLVKQTRTELDNFDPTTNRPPP